MESLSVSVSKNELSPKEYDRKEHLVEYEINIPDISSLNDESRLYIDFVGDIATVYIGNQQVNDYY